MYSIYYSTPFGTKHSVNINEVDVSDYWDCITIEGQEYDVNFYNANEVSDDQQGIRVAMYPFYGEEKGTDFSDIRICDIIKIDTDDDARKVTKVNKDWLPHQSYQITYSASGGENESMTFINAVSKEKAIEEFRVCYGDYVVIDDIEKE